MMKRYVRSVVSGYCYRKSKRKKEVEGDVIVSVELSLSSMVYKQQRDSVVSVVLAGGIVELYPGPVFASTIMEKHPGLCLARPEVFSQPHRAEVSPRERLFPGNKFYLVPCSTVNKLRQKASKQIRKEGMSGKREEAIVGAEVGWKETAKERGGGSMEEPASTAKERGGAEVGWKETAKERGGGSMEEPASTAKDFYVSKENWTECFFKRFEQQQIPIRQPNYRGRMYQGLLLGWKPSLETISEYWSP